MTKHTIKELLDGYLEDEVIFIEGGTVPLYSKSSSCAVANQLKAFIENPELFTLTDPNKPTPKVGQTLTLEQLHDVEFMRGVKEAEVYNPYTSKSLVLDYVISNWKIPDIAYAITHKDVGWTVTVAEVVEGE